MASANQSPRVNNEFQFGRTSKVENSITPRQLATARPSTSPFQIENQNLIDDSKPLNSFDKRLSTNVNYKTEQKMTTSPSSNL